MSDTFRDSPHVPEGSEPEGSESRGASPRRRRANSPPPATRRVPRRAERVVGAVLAILGMAIAVIAIIALQHPSGRAASTSTVGAGSRAVASARPSAGPVRSATRSAVTPTPAPAPGAAVPLVVLDSSGNPARADVAAARFRSAGWQVSSTGELSNDILSTCAYYDPNDPAAQPAASLLQQQFPAIARVKEKFPELPSGPIVVVLTAGYR